MAAEFAAERGQLESAQQQLAEIKPNTVPYMQELAEGSRRKTHVQLRGNYLNLAEEVTEGVPVAFHPLAEGGSAEPAGARRSGSSLRKTRLLPASR
ncbi:MAG: hypothetical protein U0836_07305 [Pirellulales bacterium]